MCVLRVILAFIFERKLQADNFWMAGSGGVGSGWDGVHWKFFWFKISKNNESLNFSREIWSKRRKHMLQIFRSNYVFVRSCVMASYLKGCRSNMMSFR